MNNDKLRDDFEAWSLEGLPWDTADDVYADSHVQTAWLGYRAAHNAQQATIDDLQRQLDPYEAEDYNRC